MTTWIIKAGKEAQAFEKFRAQNKVAIGWNSLGDFNADGDWEEFRAEVKNRLAPDYSEQKVGKAAGQLWSFIRTLKNGDIVITPSAATRKVLIGKVCGNYSYDPTFDPGLPRTRMMAWSPVISWDAIPPHLRNSFMVQLTVSRPGADMAPLIEAALSPANSNEALKELQNQSNEKPEDLIGKAEAAVFRKLVDLEHGQFQRFVGGLFIAAGFTELLNSAENGPDDGIDVILSKDALGIDERVVIQVKHTQEQIGQPKFQELLGTLRPGDFGLIVSLGNFSTTAMKCWRNNRERLLKPMGRDALVEMVNKYYDRLDDEYKRMLPLKRVLVPDGIDEDPSDES